MAEEQMVTVILGVSEVAMLYNALSRAAASCAGDSVVLAALGERLEYLDGFLGADDDEE